QKLRSQAVSHMETMLQAIDQIIDEVSRSADDARTRLRSGAETMRVALLAAQSVALVVGVVLAVLVARRIVKPIYGLADAAQRMAGGDLSVGALPVTSRDEIGRLTEAFNAML